MENTRGEHDIKDGSPPIAGWLIMVHKGKSHLEMDDVSGFPEMRVPLVLIHL